MAAKTVLFVSALLAAVCWTILFAAAILAEQRPDKEEEIAGKLKVWLAARAAWPCSGVALAALLWLIIF